MKRRDFLAGLALLPVLPLIVHASELELNVGIYPGTGTADMLRDELRASTRAFAQSLADAVGREPRLTLFTSLRSTNRSLDNGRLDLYFVPPTVAVAALDKGYAPVARVKDFLKVELVRRKGAEVSSVALTEKLSLPDVLGRYVLKNENENVKIFNLKTQKDVILAMKRNYAQAGGLGGKKAKALVETGDYEVWYPLPPSPGFTLVASDQLDESMKKELENAVSKLDPAVINEMQKVFVSKLGSFVADSDTEFKTLRQAMKAAGYI
jgi:ABC-type phosphate/phosphonate transport system substrate-binding protein